MIARTLSLVVTSLVLSWRMGSRIAATIDVTRFDDPPGPCGVDGCSLRQAVLQANLTPGADTITPTRGRTS